MQIHIRVGLAIGCTLFAACAAEVAAPVPATQQTDDAALLYQQAVDAIKTRSPSTAALRTMDYPPSLPAWRQAEAPAWLANKQMRELVRQATSLPHANWPDNEAPLPGLAILRWELTSEAYFFDYRGDHAEAARLFLDLLHLYDLMNEAPNKGDFRRTFVCKSSEWPSVYKVSLIISDIALTTRLENQRDIQVKTADEIIARLLDQRDPQDQLADIYKGEGAAFPHRPKQEEGNVIRLFKRTNAEQSMAAMAIACRIFKFEKGHWPAGLAELIPTYLPKAPIDPWGDGKQTLGYVLIKNGLPFGADRPMVYSLEGSSDGLFYFANSSQYEWAEIADSNPPVGQPKHGGQFRDVVRWEPIGERPGPATLPISQ